MAKSKQSSNPLALAVLVLLFERPMHPYEIAATLRVRNKSGSIKLRYGSLYTVIEALLEENLIEVKETVREGRRPERTIYALTQDGLKRMREWMHSLLGTPVKEYPQFEAALSLLPAVPPEEAVALLEARGVRLGEMCEVLRAAIDEAAPACRGPVPGGERVPAQPPRGRATVYRGANSADQGRCELRADLESVSRRQIMNQRSFHVIIAGGGLGGLCLGRG